MRKYYFYEGRTVGGDDQYKMFSGCIDAWFFKRPNSILRVLIKRLEEDYMTTGVLITSFNRV